MCEKAGHGHGHGRGHGLYNRTVRGAIVHHLLGGDAWFSAGALLILLLGADTSGWLAGRPRLLRVARILFLIAIGVGALSGTPVPLWLLIPLVAGLSGVVALGFREEPSRAGRFSSAVALCAVIAALAIEAPHRATPRIDLPRGASVAILGDSLSSGGFGETAPWPARLAAAEGFRAVNLSLPNETLRSALRFQLPRLAALPPPDLVIIELGGNDLLEGRPAAAFAPDLDALLAAVRSSTPGPIVMFELPVLPGRWRYGAAQRRVAADHGVALLPKRLLTKILADPRLVDDGLHLTDEGHARLARAVGGML